MVEAGFRFVVVVIVIAAVVIVVEAGFGFFVVVVVVAVAAVVVVVVVFVLMVEARFGFVFWESNRGEGGEMRKKKMVGSIKQFCSNQVTCIGPYTVEKY